MRSKFLFEIETKTIFVAALLARENNVRDRSFTIFEIPDGFLVTAHVRVIQIAKQTHCSRAVMYEAAAKFEFEIFGARPREVRVKMDAIGDFRHQRFAETYCKPMIVEL